MSFFTVDLSKAYNHKLVYDRLPETGEFGLDNICILRQDFKFSAEEWINGIQFIFSGSEADNVVCEGQKVHIGTKGKKLHFIGFGYWGIASTEEFKEVAFFDWSVNGSDIESLFMKESWGGQNDKKEMKQTTAMVSSGKLKHLIWFHHFVCEADSEKEIAELILPDNMFMHVLALTLES